MGKIQIKYNPALDFILSIFRLVFDKEIKAAEWSFKFDDNIRAYIDNINNNMSSLMKNDIEILIKNSAQSVIVPLYFCCSRGITEVDDFFEQFSKLTGEEYHRLYAEFFDITDVMNDEPAIIMQTIKEKMDVEFPSEESILDGLMEFRKYPDETKNKLDSFFRLYYEKFYSKIENKANDFMYNKLGDYIRQYEADGEEFLADLFACNISKIAEDSKQIIIYPSFFYEVGFTDIRVQDCTYITFGYLLEQRTNVDFKETRAREVLKVLADDKRYEILKMLGQKKYFSSQLADILNISKATVSYHTTKMVSLSLVNIEVSDGKRAYLTLNRKSLKENLDYIYNDLTKIQDN